MDVTVEKMALCRELRRQKQKELIDKHQMPCISFTLNIPGSVKNNELYKKIHSAGVKELDKIFSNLIQEELIYDKTTGPEAFYAINLPIEQIKIQTTYIEDNHDLGRIFDIDVINKDYRSISRTDIDRSPRKCLLCNEMAAICARSRKHSVQELLEKIDSIASASKVFNKSGS